MSKVNRYKFPIWTNVGFESKVHQFILRSNHEEIRRLVLSGFVFIDLVERLGINLGGDDYSGSMDGLSSDGKETIQLRMKGSDSPQQAFLIERLERCCATYTRQELLRKTLFHGYVFDMLNQDVGYLDSITGKSVQQLAIPEKQKTEPAEKSEQVQTSIEPVSMLDSLSATPRRRLKGIM